MEFYLNENESLHDLNLKGYKIIQSTKCFKFGTDAVLLAHFADVKKGDSVVDLGTGQGIIPIILCARTNVKKVFGIEIQQKLYDMAQRSVLYNNLSDKIIIINADLKEPIPSLPKGEFDVVTCNPPYKPCGGGLENEIFEIKAAKHEILCNLEDVIKCGAQLLRFSGRLCICHRPERLCDIICLMRQYDVEPKRLRFVHGKSNKAPSLVLIEGKRGAKAGIEISPPLIIHNEDGTYTNEVNLIYGREQTNEK